MDDVDLMILSHLCRDAKVTLSELASHLGMAVSSIHKRIKRMEREGIIERYSAIVNPEKFDCVTAFLLISAEDADKIAEKLKEIRGIIEVYKSLGNFNVVAKVRRQTLDGISEVTSRVSSMDGVMMIECIITTRRVKEEVWIPEVVGWSSIRS